tara:strand:+ start:532 stop:1191 length:660 start_codon:yes stop_codon:yes gene_type:complete
MPLNINGTTGISGVDGSVSAPALTGTDSNTGITFPSADTIKFSTGGVERMSITNSGFGGIIQGITEYDIYKLTSNLTVSSPSIFITANLARVTFFFEKIGTGVSVSSGVFSFPSTGKYEIHAIFQGFHLAGNDDLFKLGMWGTTNNSDYNAIINCRGGTDNASEAFSTSFVYLIDIPDISTHKIKFGTESAGTNAVQLDGANNNTLDGTYFVFKKVGET